MMIRLLCRTTFLIILFYSQIAISIEIGGNYQATWTGIEVMGADFASAEKIRSLNLVTIGTTFRSDQAKYYCDQCKENIRKKTEFKNAYCGLVWYGEGVAYLIVEALGKNLDSKNFRRIPKNQNFIKKIPKELSVIHAKWDKQFSALMSRGNFSIEKINEDFRDSSDPILHALALQLAQLVPKYNAIMLDVLHCSPLVKERQKAAQLFAWSNHAENLPYVLEWDLLADPDSRVRNDLARSFSVFMAKIKDEELLTNLIPAYCKQATLPSHADRNKSLVSILNILETHPKLITVINGECKKNIEYISKTSILENVREPAKNILKILKEI